MGRDAMSRRKQSNPKPLKRIYSERGSNEEEDGDSTVALNEHVEMNASTIYAKKNLQEGIIFGPYKGSVSKAENPEQKDEETIKLKGEEDGLVYNLMLNDDTAKWLAHIDTQPDESKVNALILHEGEEVWCKTIKAINEGSEIYAKYHPTMHNEVAMKTVESSSDEDYPPNVTSTQLVKSESPITHDVISNQPPTVKAAPPYTCEKCGTIFQCQSNFQVHHTYYCKTTPGSLPPPPKKIRLMKIGCGNENLENALETKKWKVIDSQCEEMKNRLEVNNDQSKNLSCDQESDNETGLSGSTDDNSIISNENIPLLKCNVCTFATKSECTLQEHFNNSHISQEPSMCEKCKMVFYSRSQLMMHMLERHSMESDQGQNSVKGISSHTVKRAVALAMGQAIEKKHKENSSETEVESSTCSNSSSEDSSLNSEEIKYNHKVAKKQKRKHSKNKPVIESSQDVKNEEETDANELMQVDETTMCFECNIHFNSRKNFAAHKTYYCASRHQNTKSNLKNKSKELDGARNEHSQKRAEGITQLQHTENSPNLLNVKTMHSRRGSVDKLVSPVHHSHGMMIAPIQNPLHMPPATVYNILCPVSSLPLNNRQRITPLKSSHQAQKESSDEDQESNQPLDLSLKPKRKKVVAKEPSKKGIPIRLHNMDSSVAYIPIVGLPIPQPVLEFKCHLCDISYSKEESYLAHKKYYCASHHPPQEKTETVTPAREEATVRESIATTSIEHAPESVMSAVVDKESNMQYDLLKSGTIKTVKTIQDQTSTDDTSSSVFKIGTLPTKPVNRLLDTPFTLKIKQDPFSDGDTESTKANHSFLQDKDIKLKAFNTVENSLDSSQECQSHKVTPSLIKVKNEPADDKSQVPLTVTSNDNSGQESEDEDTTHCIPCNIKFNSRKNYLVHKTIYCNSRKKSTDDVQKSVSPPIRTRSRSNTKQQASNTPDQVVKSPRHLVVDKSIDNALAPTTNKMACHTHSSESVIPPGDYMTHSCQALRCSYFPCVAGTPELPEHSNSTNCRSYKCGPCGFNKMTKEDICSGDRVTSNSIPGSDVPVDSEHKHCNVLNVSSSAPGKLETFSSFKAGTVVYFTPPRMAIAVHTPSGGQSHVTTVSDIGVQTSGDMAVESEEQSGRSSVIKTVKTGSKSPSPCSSDTLSRSDKIQIKREPIDDSRDIRSSAPNSPLMDHKLVDSVRQIKTERPNSMSPTILGRTPNLQENASAVMNGKQSAELKVKRPVQFNYKHCKLCNIQFSNLSTFIAHKKFYCASHHTDNAVK